MIVTLAEMKTRLGISDAASDVFLTSQLALIQNALEFYCRRKFDVDDYVETIYREDLVVYTREITLFHYPLNSITSVVYDTDNTLTDYRLHKPTGRITPTSSSFDYSTDIVVTYNAGYTTMPESLKEIVYGLVSQRYNKNAAGVDLNFGSDVQRISVPGTLAIDFDYSLQNNDRKTALGVILGEYVNVADAFRSERSIIGKSRLEYVETP